MKKILTILGIAMLTAVGYLIYQSNLPTSTIQNQETVPLSQEQPGQGEFSFQTPKKSAHYETNTPAHGAVLPAPPRNVAIDFNFDLAAPSSISIMNGGKEYGISTTQIDPNKLTMRRDVDPNAPDGKYLVMYKACWPDGSCHDGQFEFVVDKTVQASYEDKTGQSEVVVKMSGLMFQPSNIKVTAGTKVTWVNDEDVVHYVNTDSHPAHTFFPEQNSSALDKGESYSVTFAKAGAYPYHCSAHANSMIGNVLVI
jgi:plastocyanin